MLDHVLTDSDFELLNKETEKLFNFCLVCQLLQCESGAIHNTNESAFQNSVF